MAHRKQPRRNAARWAPVPFFALLSALLFASDEPSLGLFVLLAMLVPYLALFAPLRCRAVTQKGTRCRNIGIGLFVGCHLHRLDHLARILTRDRPVRPVRPVRPARPAAAPGARSGAIPPADPGVSVTRVAYDLAMLVIAAVSALAGVLAPRGR
ncbi:hypothetical protein [Phytohabitans houttuyneae]|uniref:Uncharacterized protein n=1 Tax=Phytohabitans houttuyneae TaxID=1076126 RepID=A0A6V8KFE2_9ACTN|nr:hypothetical protein [Phytohabitans houttuyneae]GFJ82534.1 hypothetical protein Phou_067140 [Phytohabitans houttuyneae]